MLEWVRRPGRPGAKGNRSARSRGRIAWWSAGRGWCLEAPVGSFSIFADSATVGFVNPDNIAVGRNSIMVQEDSSTLVAGSLDNDVWQYSMGSASWTEIASATQVATAETSGIVDMSKWLGAGWWALDVQSHVNLIEGSSVAYGGPGPANGLMYKERREDGQLLLMYVPGS